MRTLKKTPNLYKHSSLILRFRRSTRTPLACNKRADVPCCKVSRHLMHTSVGISWGEMFSRSWKLQTPVLRLAYCNMTKRLGTPSSSFSDKHFTLFSTRGDATPCLMYNNASSKSRFQLNRDRAELRSRTKGKFLVGRKTIKGRRRIATLRDFLSPNSGAHCSFARRCSWRVVRHSGEPRLRFLFREVLHAGVGLTFNAQQS